MQLKALYRRVSITLPGAADAAATAAAVRDFITIEERCAAAITPVATTTLTDLTYAVVDTTKCRREPLVQLRQADGELFWVPAEELAANALCLNMHQQPERFAVSQKVAYRNFAEPPERPLLVVESAEPVSLLVDLGAAVQCDVDRAPPAPPTLLVVTGAAGAGKSALVAALAASMPERVVRPNVVATSALPWADAVDVIPAADFAEHVAKGAFMYHAETRAHAPEQGNGAPQSQLMQWGLMKEEFAEITAGTRDVFVVVEEHPAGAAAARAAAPGALLLAVTVPDLDTMDQRLRASRKEYEEQQARSRFTFAFCLFASFLHRLSGSFNLSSCDCEQPIANGLVNVCPETLLLVCCLLSSWCACVISPRRLSQRQRERENQPCTSCRSATFSLLRPLKLPRSRPRASST